MVPPTFTHVLWALGGLQCVLLTRFKPRSYVLQVLHRQRPICSAAVESQSAATAIAADLRTRLVEWRGLEPPSETDAE